MKHIYSYEGPVIDKLTGRVLADKVNKHIGRTQAVSEAQAMSNIMFNWKRNNNYVVNLKIYLPGKLTLVQ